MDCASIGTWVTAEVVTAALLNAHVRDNLLETSAATATTAGDLVYADAANSMGSRLGIESGAGSILASTGSAPVWRTVVQSVGDALYTGVGNGTTPTVFADLSVSGWGAGTTVAALNVVSGTRVLLHYGSRNVRGVGAGITVSLSYKVTGDTTTTAAVNWGTADESSNANDFQSVGRSHVATVTAGTNHFTLQAASSSTNDGSTLSYPYIIAIPL